MQNLLYSKEREWSRAKSLDERLVRLFLSTEFQWIRGFLISGLVIFVWSTGAGRALGKSIDDEALGFRLTLPEGFTESRALSAIVARPEFVYAFVKGEAADDEVVYMLILQKMGGVIGREELLPEHLPAEFNDPQILTLKWQGFDISCIEAVQEEGQFNVVRYAAQIPLKREAIQVILVGPVDRKAEMRADLEMILNNLHGPSNWIPSVLPNSTTDSITYTIALVLVGAVALIAGLAGIWRISRKYSFRAAFGVATCLFLLGNLIRFQHIRVREVLLLQATFSLTGSLGLVQTCVLYVVDRIRRKRRDAESALISDSK